MYEKHIINSENKYKANIWKKLLAWFPNLASKTDNISPSANKNTVEVSLYTIPLYFHRYNMKTVH